MEHADLHGKYTASMILGLLYRHNSLDIPNGAPVIKKDVGGETAVVYGVVRLIVEGYPIEERE
jgi:hypothetical protein